MIASTDIYGFRPGDRKAMNEIFQNHPELNKVIIFGSRALHTFNNASDVDFAISYNGADRLSTLSSIKYKLEEETGMPYFFDVIDLDNISSKELAYHIEKHGIVFYEKVL